MEGHQLLNAVFLGTFRDSLVNGAKHFFVMCRSLREIHAGPFSLDLPQKTKSLKNSSVPTSARFCNHGLGNQP